MNAEEIKTRISELEADIKNRELSLAQELSVLSTQKQILNEYKKYISLLEGLENE